MLKTECIDEYGRMKTDCQANHKNDSLGKLKTFSQAHFVIKNFKFEKFQFEIEDHSNRVILYGRIFKYFFQVDDIF